MKRHGRFAVDLSGQRFGRWTVVANVGTNSGGHAVFRCACDCGVSRNVVSLRLRGGTSRSCGCLARELSSARKKTHGLSKHPLFPTWCSMMNRCYSPRSRAYPDYGGRGILVCDRWRDARHFIADNEGKNLPGLEIDRADNNGPYAPDNCRWVERSVQSGNKRSNIWLTHDGRTMILFDWARETGIPPRTLWSRIKKMGWPTDKALTTPADKTNRRSSEVAYNGVTATVGNHARAHSLKPTVVAMRVAKYGWSLDRALTTPSRGRR